MFQGNCCVCEPRSWSFPREILNFPAVSKVFIFFLLLLLFGRFTRNGSFPFWSTSKGNICSYNRTYLMASFIYRIPFLSSASMYSKILSSLYAFLLVSSSSTWKDEQVIAELPDHKTSLVRSWYYSAIKLHELWARYLLIMDATIKSMLQILLILFVILLRLVSHDFLIHYYTFFSLCTLKVGRFQYIYTL
jgi:hypothetical protein